MKTNLINVLTVKMRSSLLPLMLLMISFFISASSLIPDQEVKKKDEASDRKLTLLEKLEKGTPVRSEEIRSCFDEGDEIEIDFEYPVMISHKSMEEMKESVREGMEDLRHEMWDLKNSEEFKDAMEELRKGGEEIRREMEKMREEFERSGILSFDWENC